MGSVPDLVYGVSVDALSLDTHRRLHLIVVCAASGTIPGAGIAPQQGLQYRSGRPRLPDRFRRRIRMTAPDAG